MRDEEDKNIYIVLEKKKNMNFTRSRQMHAFRQIKVDE